MRPSYDTLVKEVITKNYTIALLQVDGEYRIYVEHLNTQTCTAHTADLKLALGMFDDALTQVQGH